MKLTRRQFLSATTLLAGSAASWPARIISAADAAPKPVKPLRCRVTPLPEHQAVFELAGRETTRWHFGPQYPRPFFFPFNGPSGDSLTRMGHPGAPNHDHHRSIWFAHADVDRVDFWGDGGKGRIRQKEWLCYEDAQAHSIMAVRLGWFDGEPGRERERMEQTLVAINRESGRGEHTLELQSTFRAVNGPVHLGKTNFGFLAVRVAKSISGFFGGGRLTDGEGRTGEAAIFGRRAAWMDYSGPVANGAIEGITYFDHPLNPGAPTHWHVREDGWMGAAFCLAEGRVLQADQPLRLRYLLHAHRGPVKAKAAERIRAAFVEAPAYSVVPGRQHRQYELRSGSHE